MSNYKALALQIEARAREFADKPIPEECEGCPENCPRWYYEDGGCHVFILRPADEGSCKKEWGVKG